MECYRCPVSVTKEECQQNQFLDLCITGYTTCFTQVKYAIGSRAILNVTKSCVDDTFCENERSKTENPNCDVLSEDNYDCVWCCHEDKCNENSAGHFLQGDYSAILVTMVIAISFHVLQLLSSSEGNLLSVGDR
ncbi:hypothetical protein BSL78_11648 [Apostichopus japonicus]|uniref:UPAR/Ly6 domain-containing protein n=1 Tax=Stichopus japonicus TaxID=307972 RepID=A0A2G8KTZ2_STIJA|nr:hypothetical protein BSL78_11648 [Apostichopus japonicus]